MENRKTAGLTRRERISKTARIGALGFSTIELVVVVAIILVIAGFTIPNLLQSWTNAQLRTAASEVSDLMQQAKITAAKNNATYSLGFQLVNGKQKVFIDLNNNGVLDNNEPVLELSSQINAAAGAPAGGAGQPTPFRLTTDTSTGTPCDNTCTLAYSPRGLPCNYSAPPTCSTPAATYFVYYFTNVRTGGWSAVLVTKTGRSKALLWGGNSWN